MRFRLSRTVGVVMPVQRLVALAMVMVGVIPRRGRAGCGADGMMVVGTRIRDIRRECRRPPEQEERGDHEDRSHDDVSR